MNLFSTFRLFVLVGLVFCAGIIANQALGATEEAGPSRQNVRDALERSVPFILEEGKAWMNGDVDIQEGDGCVSCHQVPSGVWALAATHRALTQDLEAESQQLIQDATDFVSDNAVGRAATWGQLLIAQSLFRDSAGEEVTSEMKEWLAHLESIQLEEGGWESVGQFPKQRREIGESDAVITMWVIYGLQRSTVVDQHSAANIIERGLESLDAISVGVSTEWIAWRAITETEQDQPEEADAYFERLLDRQREDGSWGWQAGDRGDAYSTSVAIFGLLHVAESEPHRSAIARGLQYLLNTQSEDGSWPTPSERITSQPTSRRDYVYHYWATAWAAIAMATSLESNLYASE